MQKAKTGGGAGNIIVPLIYDKTSINLGTHKTQYPYAPVIKLRDILDRHADGLLGIKDLDSRPYKLDFEHNQLILLDSLPHDLSSWQSVPIRYENSRLYIKLSVVIDNQNITGWYLIDTGSSGTIDFTAHTSSLYRLDSIPRKKRITDITNFGVGNKEQEYVVDMKSDQIILVRDTLHNITIGYIPEGVGAFGKREWLGVIGNGIWSNYNIIIDTPHKNLYLKRFQSLEKSEASGYDYGFRNRTDICDGWIVSSLVRDGDALKAGIEIGDTIMAINHKPVKDFTWDEEWAADDMPTQEIELRGKSGQLKHIFLEAKTYWQERNTKPATYTEIKIKENPQQSFSKSIPAGDYSGISYLGDNKYAVVDDKASPDGFSIFYIEIDSISGIIREVELKTVKNSGQPNRDGEGITYCPSRNTIFISGEKDNTIKEYTLDSQLTGNIVFIPDSIKQNLNSNKGLESLSWNEHTQRLWTATEDEDCRLLEYDSNLKLVNVWKYKVDPATSKQDYVNGVSEICALADGRILVLEREVMIPKKKIGAWAECKLYVAKPINGQMEKQLLTKWKTKMNMTNHSFANYEGMCLGPKLYGGRQVFILLADSQHRYKGILKDWFKTFILDM
uniref:PDZ domain-containing protein n=1 Tax=Prevotella sp. GTC17254 TaxID=3236794 RepID=A0AB33IWR8_9BACT